MCDIENESFVYRTSVAHIKGTRWKNRLIKSRRRDDEASIWTSIQNWIMYRYTAWRNSRAPISGDTFIHSWSRSAERMRWTFDSLSFSLLLLMCTRDSRVYIGCWYEALRSLGLHYNIYETSSLFVGYTWLRSRARFDFTVEFVVREIFIFHRFRSCERNLTLMQSWWVRLCVETVFYDRPSRQIKLEWRGALYTFWSALTKESAFEYRRSS